MKHFAQRAGAASFVTDHSQKGFDLQTYFTNILTSISPNDLLMLA